MTSSEVSMSGTAGDGGWNQYWRERNTRLAISHEMQPGTNWTGPAGSLSRPEPSEQQGRGAGLSGLLGPRSFYLTGCFINVIKHRQALWFCIMADLHSREKKGEINRGRRERRWDSAVGEREGEQGHEIGRIRQDETREDRAKQGG